MSVNREKAMAWRLGRRVPDAKTIAIAVLFAAGLYALMQWKQSIDEQGGRLETQVLEARAARQSRNQDAEIATPAISAAGQQQRRQRIALLNRDWSRLLNSLEPADPEIELLTIEANPATGSVYVTGSATTPGQANVYAEQLQGHGVAVQQVRLHVLERQPGGYKFEVGAKWKD